MQIATGRKTQRSNRRRQRVIAESSWRPGGSSFRSDNLGLFGNRLWPSRCSFLGSFGGTLSEDSLARVSPSSRAQAPAAPLPQFGDLGQVQSAIASLSRAETIKTAIATKEGAYSLCAGGNITLPAVPSSSSRIPPRIADDGHTADISLTRRKLRFERIDLTSETLTVTLSKDSVCTGRPSHRLVVHGSPKSKRAGGRAHPKLVRLPKCL